jgi:glycosyltransferase involved in cell wall biosynthesis
MMDITVILCTYNRGASLSKALDSVAASVVPDSVVWEVLIVDNNSTDETRGVAEEFCHQHPGRFRYLFESMQGKSHALNSGVRSAKGAILAFMDDDVVVEPTWLQNLTANLHSGEWAGAGGRILPAWNAPPPRWLSLEGRYSLAPLAVFDLGADDGPLEEPPFGTNMAFRREMFEKYGGFRLDLGPTTQGDYREWYSATCPRTSEDTEFGERLLAAGARLRYEATAVVHHPVTESRLKKGYFLAWRYGQARANIRQYGVPPETKWFLARVPLFMIRRLAMGTIRWITTFEPRRRFRYKLAAWASVGQIVECRRRSTHANISKTNRESNVQV